MLQNVIMAHSAFSLGVRLCTVREICKSWMLRKRRGCRAAVGHNQRGLPLATVLGHTNKISYTDFST
jgi:hypothetical protein